MTAVRPRFLALLLTAAACRKPAPPHTPPRPLGRTSVSVPSESRPYVHVETAEAPPPTLERSFFARVSFDERHVAALGSPVSGRVVAVHVVAGARVTVGQPLVTIRSADLATAHAQLLEARQGRMLAEQNAARAHSLVAQGAGSVAEEQIAATALAQAVTEERRTAQALGVLGGGAGSADFVLRSTIAGTVVDRSVQPGNAISGDAGQPLVTVADLSSVWVLADVFEQDVGAIHTQDLASVTVPALEGRVFSGRVSHVGDVIDATTRTARARIEIPNPDNALRPGMFAEVRVRSAAQIAAMVPVSAVLARRDEFFVFVPSGADRYDMRGVHVGSQVGDHIAIVDGLRPGESVVTRGAILLDAEANAAL